MDRDNNYDRVQKAYEALTEGRGDAASSAEAAIVSAAAEIAVPLRNASTRQNFMVIRFMKKTPFL